MMEDDIVTVTVQSVNSTWSRTIIDLRSLGRSMCLVLPILRLRSVGDRNTKVSMVSVGNTGNGMAW
jgi:hypothetical protein